MKKSLLASTLIAATALAVAPAVFAADEGSASVDYEYTITAKSEKTPSGGTLENYNGFKGIGVTVDGTVTGFTLTGSEGSAISSSNVYITGTGEKESSLTITEINIAESEKTYNSGLEAFIVENATVILDGGVTESGGESTIDTGKLGLTLVVGTLSDATLDITGGARVTFNGIWNTLGSNLHTGTINISGEGSYLCTQQISIGMVYVSLSGGASITDGYYFAQYLESDSDRDAVVAAVTSGTYYEGSYGIINVTDGGTYAVGVGNTDPSNNRLQLSNGEINIDGEGSSMVLGKNSSILMMGENGLYVTDEDGSNMHIATGVYYTEKITVTGGGSVVNEDGTSLRQAIFGDSFYAANTTVEVSVEGEGSTFDIAVGNDNANNTYDYALFGSVYGYYQDFKGVLDNGGDTYLGDGGSADVSISASDGGSFKVSAQEGIYAALDNAADYFDKQGDYKGAPPDGQAAGHSYGINVEFAATTGGTIELEATEGSNVVLAAGSAAEGYSNSVTVLADGDGSSVSISGANIYTNAHNADNVSVEITATNGGEITLSAAEGEGVISLGKNTTIIVENGSSLTTEGTVTFGEGASIKVDATSSWTTSSPAVFTDGLKIEIGIAASANGNEANVDLGKVTVSKGSSITVVIDVSELEANTEASVAVLTAESIIFEYISLSDYKPLDAVSTTLTSDNVNDFVAGYITCEENGFTIESWTWDDDSGTLYANIRTMPEPSMFGLFLGFAAIGLTATRRRRKVA